MLIAPLALALSPHWNPCQTHVRPASEGSVSVPVAVGNPWEGSHSISPQAGEHLAGYHTVPR
jgi:hypothetical protein